MLDDLREEMTRYAEENQAALVVLMLTDINLGDTRLWFADLSCQSYRNPARSKACSVVKTDVAMAGTSVKTASVSFSSLPLWVGEFMRDHSL